MRDKCLLPSVPQSTKISQWDKLSFSTDLSHHNKMLNLQRNHSQAANAQLTRRIFMLMYRSIVTDPEQRPSHAVYGVE